MQEIDAFAHPIHPPISPLHGKGDFFACGHSEDNLATDSPEPKTFPCI